MYGGYKQGNNIICNCLLSVNVFDLRVREVPSPWFHSFHFDIVYIAHKYPPVKFCFRETCKRHVMFTMEWDNRTS